MGHGPKLEPMVPMEGSYSGPSPLLRRPWWPADPTAWLSSPLTICT